MLKCIKINFVYFISKKNLLSLIACYLIVLFVTVFIVNDNLSLSLSFEEKQMYTWDMLFSFYKLIIITLSCFLMNNFIISSNDNYKVLFIINLKNKNLYYIAKILTIIISLISFVFLSFIFYLIVNVICNKNYILKIEYIKGFVLIALLSFVYGVISMIISKIFDNTICVLIPIILYISSEFFEFNGNIINTFFPNFFLDVIDYSFGLYTIHYLVLTTFYIILFFVILKE